MMKKLIATLLALMMCLGCAASLAQQSHAKEDYIGYWRLEDLSLMGYEVTAEELGRKGFVSFHEDETVIVSLAEGEFFTSLASYAGGACTLKLANADSPVIIGDDGRLSFNLVKDDVSMTLTFAREAYPQLPADIAAMVGSWEMTVAKLGSQSIPAAKLFDSDCAVYPDGHGVITADGERMPFRLVMEGNSVSWVDNEGSADPVYMNAAGELCFELTSDDATIIMVMERKGGAVTEPAAETTTAVTAAASLADFNGTWKGVDLTLMGMPFSLEDAGLEDLTLVVADGTASITIGGDSGSGKVTMRDGAMVFSNGEEELVCTLADGYMYMSMQVSGLEMKIRLSREQGSAPAAAQGSAFDGEWTAVTYEVFGMQLSAAEMDMTVTLTLDGDSAVLSMDGDSTRCSLIVDGNKATVTDGKTDIPCELTEDGRLHATLESDGLTMLMIMERTGGNAPAASTAAPAATEATGYDGDWYGVSVSALGMDFTLEELELGVISLQITGDSAVLNFSDQSGRCRVTYGADGIVVDDGSTEMPGYLNEKGQLVLTLESDGVTMTLYMERRGGNAAPAATQAPAAHTSGEAYKGLWNTVSVSAMGQTFQLKDLGMEAVTLDFDGDKAVLSLGSESQTCSVTYTADGVVVDDGSSSMPGSINAQGQLVMELTSGDVVMYLYMERVSDAPAATGEAPELRLNKCSICSGMHDASRSQLFGDMIVCPTCFQQYFN